MSDGANELSPRIALLRRLCRETGSLADRVKTVDDVLLSSTAIRYELWGELEQIIKMSVRWVPENEYARAATNALGLTPGGTDELDPTWNLTTRRRHYLESNPEVSERTLIRHELLGITQVAKMIDKVQDRILEALEEPATKSELRALRRRVKDLEATVAELARLIDRD